MAWNPQSSRGGGWRRQTYSWMAEQAI